MMRRLGEAQWSQHFHTLVSAEFRLMRYQTSLR